MQHRWSASPGNRGIGVVAEDSENWPSNNSRRDSKHSQHSPQQQQHPQRFREFLAAELAALEEKLASRFELGEPPSPRKNSRRESDSLLPSFHLSFARHDSVATMRSMRSSVMSHEDDSHDTRSKWERIVIRLLQSVDPDSISFLDLVLRITREREEQERADREEQERAEFELEELVTPHPVWMSQMMSSTRESKRYSMVKNIFAMSRVAEGSVGSGTLGDEHRPGAGGASRWIVIHPESIFRYVWTLVGALFLMHDLFTIPMEAAQLMGGSSSRLMEVTIAYWSADLLCQGLMGYHVQNHIEMRPLKTLRHYASTWMPLDATVLFLDIAFYVFRLNSTARSIRIVKLLRLVRLARLHKWVLAMRSIMKSNTSELADLLVKVGRLMFLLVCHCHFTACAWYGIAEAFEGAERPPGSFPNWVEANGLSAQSNFLCYVVALHWSITQFTPATNNVVPVNGAERTFAIVVVLLGFVAFSAFLSSMMGTLGQLKSLKQSQVKERQQLLQFFRNKRVPAVLADRVLLLFDAEGELTRDNLVEEDLPALLYLPTSIRLRIRREYCAPLLRMNTIFGGVYRLDRRCFLQIMHDGMVDKRYNAQQEVFVDGIGSSSMYAVSSGKLKYYQRGALTWLGHGEWVSEPSLYVKWVHQGSLVAKTCSIILQLDCNVCRQVVLQTGGDLFRTMRSCAVLFAHKLECYAEEVGCLSDLGVAPQDQEEILWRSLKICNVVHRRSSIRGDEEVLEVETRRKSLRLSLNSLRSLVSSNRPNSDSD